MFRTAQWLAYGYMHFGRSGYATGLKAEGEDVEKVDMRKKTVFVTGGNAGLGFETCARLARMGATVLMAVRSEAKGEEAKKKIGLDNVHVVLCDVASQESVRQLIAQVSQLDVLILNAGSLFPDGERKENDDGVELTLATNVLNNVQLVEGLLPLLRQSGGRVVFVSSGGGLLEGLCRSDASYEQKGKFEGAVAYSRTKRMQMALAKYYARREPNVFFCAMHPGWAETDGVKTSIASFYNTFKGSFRSAAEGADTIVWLAASQSPTLRKLGGALFRDRAVEMEHFTWAGTQYNTEDENALHAWLTSKIKH